MAGREEEYIRRMKALGYEPSLAGMDDEDAEWELAKIGEAERRREAPQQPLRKVYRPVDPGLAAMILRMFGQPYDESAIPKGQEFYLNSWDNGDDDGTLVGKERLVEPAPPRNGARGTEWDDPWAKAWKLDWGKEDFPAEKVRTMEYQWGRDGAGLASRGGARNALGGGFAGADAATGMQEANNNIDRDRNGNGNWMIDPLGMFPQYEGTGAPPPKSASGIGTLDRYRSNESVPVSNNTSEIKLWKDENPDWDNLQQPMKEATTSFISEINKNFGTEKTPWITSGYRSPERNASTPGASSRSWHVEGLAVDINLEDYSQEERAEIEKMARERFDEVIFHDAGTGMHLHIGNPLKQDER